MGRFISTSGRACRTWACFVLAAASMPAFGFYQGMPSTRWITTSAPFSPTSAQDCTDLSREFFSIIRELSAQHDRCLQNAPPGERSGPTCSKASCQSFHTARDNAQRKAAEEGRVCNQRLQAHLARERKRQAQARQWEEDARQRQLQRDRDRQQADADWRARQEQRDQRERERDAAREQRQRAAEAEREMREQQRQRELAQISLPPPRREERTQVADLAVLAAQQQAAQRARDAADRGLYERLVAEVQGVRDAVNTGREFVQNPFAAAADAASSTATDRLVQGTVALAMPGIQDRPNPFYDASADVVDRVRERALAGNPFAERAAAASMAGAHSAHRRALGELDQALAGAAAGSASSEVRSVTPTGRMPGVPAGAQPADEGALQAAVRLPEVNPFGRPAQGGGSTAAGARAPALPSVPAGHVLYRAPGSSSVTVLSRATLTGQRMRGDRAELGDRGCSADGVGVVTPECERLRAAGSR